MASEEKRVTAQEYQEVFEGVLRVLTACRVVDPSSGEIVSLVKIQAEISLPLTSKEWMVHYNRVFQIALHGQQERQLYVDLCRTVVLFLQELSFAYNFCTPATAWTVDELQQSFSLVMETGGKVFHYLDRYWIPGNLGNTFEGFKVVHLKELAAELWRDHFVVIDRREDDEEPSVSFHGLKDTTRTCLLAAFAENGRPPVLQGSIAKIAQREAAERAHCLLFCCLKRAATAHEYADPPIGAVPIPVMQGAVEHAGSLLITPPPFERMSEPAVRTCVRVYNTETEQFDTEHAESSSARSVSHQPGTVVVSQPAAGHTFVRHIDPRPDGPDAAFLRLRKRREAEAPEAHRNEHAQEECKQQARASEMDPPASKRARTDHGNITSGDARLGDPAVSGESGGFTATELNPVTQTLTSHEPATSGGGGSADGVAAGVGADSTPLSDEDVQRLCSLGFEATEARRALQLTAGNLDQAAALLLDG